MSVKYKIRDQQGLHLRLSAQPTGIVCHDVETSRQLAWAWGASR